MSIENPTLAHFRHFSSLFTPSHLYICRGFSTNQPFLCKTNPILSAVGGLQMNVNSLITKDYENKWQRRVRKNKPNSNPIQTQSNPICRMPKMSVNSILTKDYERYDIFAVPENKPNSNPIQTQSKPILEAMIVNFCAAGYYEINPTFAANNPKGRYRHCLEFYGENPPFGGSESWAYTQPRCFCFLVLSNCWLTLYIVYCLISPDRPWRLSLVLKWVFLKAGFLVLVRRFLPQICITFGFRNS